MPVEARSLKELFLAALDVAPAERAAWLDRACGPDAELRWRVELMLAAHDTPHSLLDRPAPVAAPPEGGTSPFAAAEAERPSNAQGEEAGTVVAGRYKLLEQIGEGGMGTVWMAQQTEPVRRLVAVKLIKAGLGSKAMLARFEAERQALALMDHPNIAKVLDAGAAPDGRPFFVMELVKGVPVTRYCDEHRLTPKQRLELFMPVCHAVQHAHQKGIIHRDLKPSNIVVAQYDDRPVPKVIDFGVAKATGRQLTEQTLHTGFGAVVGTVEYMSPEQASFDQLDVDTRSDIYSLGVLLYELLAGSPPFSRKELEKAGMLEMLRVIREQEPSKPSTKLSTAEGLPTLAANRGTEPAKLTRLVRGELDWIVMKALEKDRNRRYESASALAADVQRYLLDEPVQACPPSAGYRLQKFVRRNKGALATASLLALAVLVVVGVVAGSFGWMARDRSVRQAKLQLQMEHALDDADKARAQALTHTNDPYRWEAALTEAAFALKRAQELDAQDKTAIAPALRERLQAAQATLNADTTDRRFAARFEEIRLEQAEVNVAISVFKPQVAFTALKEAFQRQYHIEFGVTPVEQAVTILQQRPKAVQDFLLAALEVSLDDASREDRQAGPWLTSVLDAADTGPWRKRAQQAVQASDWKALDQLIEEAATARQPPSLLLRLARMIPDSSIHNQVARRIQRAYPGDFWANHDLANWLHYDTQPPHLEESIRYYYVALALRPGNPAVCVNLGNALFANGDLDGAIRAYHEAVDGHPDYTAAHIMLAEALLQQNRPDEARAEYRKAIELDPKNVQAYLNLGISYATQGRWKEAAAAFDRGLELDPVDHERWCQDAYLHLEAGDVGGYRRACQELVKRFGDTDDAVIAEQTANACLMLPDALGAAESERVQRLAERAVTGTEEHGWYRFFVVAKGLADYRAGRYAEAVRRMEQFPPSADGTHLDATKLAVLAMAYHGWGRAQEAEAALAKAKSILDKSPDPEKGRPFPVDDVVDWLYARILYREAEKRLRKEAGTKDQESGKRPN
jgi:serine/threonine protein kinase/Flp pilus assembly protein TadD